MVVSLKRLDALISRALKQRDAAWNPNDRREYRRLGIEHGKLVKQRWSIVNKWDERRGKQCRSVNYRGSVTALSEEPGEPHLLYCIHCGESVRISDLSA